jgi:predicted GNAT family N-acyltransferase
LSAEFRVRDADWAGDASGLWQVRRTVFIIEQQVPEDLEWDEADAISLHALAEDAGGNPIATGRLLADGHIGRIAVLAAWRGRGVGAAIFEYLIAAALRRGHRELLLNAQTHATGFYARYGFVPCGPEFIEAGIPHRPMRRQQCATGNTG